ncbi:MAG: lipid-A-disaccharide synthase-related protein [Pseudanabaenaceae cyanobacterium]
MPEILCLSNGHGEDEVGARLAVALQARGCTVQALPIVGQGDAYTKRAIACWAEFQHQPPSGGFARMGGQPLWADLRHGLIQATLKQVGAVRRFARRGGWVVAVGDVVPLATAWWGGGPYAFVATAKSEYYWRDEAGVLPGQRPPWGGSEFYPWERWWMGHRRCRAAFVRDRLTAQHLQQRFRLPVHGLGNPMMDDLPAGELPFLGGEWVVVLLPGSRPPEAYRNWERLLLGVGFLLEAFPYPLRLVAALAPSLALEPLQATLQRVGWQAVDDLTYRWSGGTYLHLVRDRFGPCLHACHFGLTAAGTATEQLVGLGKPAIALVGQGPQFNRAFALAQGRLLGPSLRVVTEPRAIAQAALAMLNDPDYFQMVMANGRERMGEPGATARIVDCLLQAMGKD